MTLMLWEALTKSKLNTIVFLWIVFAAITCMATFSPIIILFIRYCFLPHNALTLPLDFIGKSVRTQHNQVTAQQVALVDLTQHKSLSNEDYSIDLNIRLPRNEINRYMGNFAIRGALGDHDWTSSAQLRAEKVKHFDSKSIGPNTVERMAIIPYRSDLVETVQRVLFTPLYALGLSAEESTLHINLWANANRPRTQHPFLMITVPSELWISHAELRLEVRLHGLRWLLRAYPVSSLVVGSIFLFLAQVSSAILVTIMVYLKFANDFSPPIVKRQAASFSKNRHPSARKIQDFNTSSSTTKNSENSSRAFLQVRDTNNDETLADISIAAEKATIVKSPDEDILSFTDSEIGLLTPQYP